MALNMGFHTPQPPQLLPALPPPFGLPLFAIAGLGLGLATATAPLLAKPWRGGMTIPPPWPLPPGATNPPLPPVLPYIMVVKWVKSRAGFVAQHHYGGDHCREKTAEPKSAGRVSQTTAEAGETRIQEFLLAIIVNHPLGYIGQHPSQLTHPLPVATGNQGDKFQPMSCLGS